MYNIKYLYLSPNKKLYTNKININKLLIKIKCLKQC